MRRFALRRLRSDDEGLGLLETVVALLVFSLIMTGLAGSMIAFEHSTALGRARASAASLAQQYVEKARAVGGTLLENCSNQTPVPPATTSFHGKSGLTVVTGADSNCIKYKTTTTQDNLSFAVTRTVILVQSSQLDVAGNAVNEKYFVVQISWTDAGGAAKTYELDTIFNQKGALTATPAQGIRFVIKDLSGNILSADSSSWSVTIKDSQTGTTLYTSPDAVTAEGTYSQVDLLSGTYWCQVTSTDDASASYFPAAKPTYNSSYTLSASQTGGTVDTIGGSCQVSASTVTDFPTTWQSSTDCATSATAKGTVNFTVTDSKTGANLPNMVVKLTQLTDNTKTYTSGKTGANGTTPNLQPLANLYTYTVTDASGNYVMTQNSFPPICVVTSTTATNYAISMKSASSCPTTGTATVNITVRDVTSKNGLNGYTPTMVSTSGYVSTAFPATKNVGGVDGFSTHAMTPGLYYYGAGKPPAGSTYQGSGWLGNTDGTPICISNGETRNLFVDLSSPAPCTRTTGKHAFVTMTVTDQANKPINGATIHLINVNGDGDYTATTGADGKPNTTNNVNGTSVESINVSDVDPYEYYVTGPDGNYLASGVSAPFCTTLNSLTTITPNVQLPGLFNVSVTVTDSDIVAYKNYQISVVDTTGKIIQTQYVSVPNCQCNGNPSSPITFTGITTGSYLIKVCAQIKTNCSVIDTAPDQPPSGTTTYYQYLTPGQTYTSTTTTTPAGGYADLATVDQSGGA